MNESVIDPTELTDEYDIDFELYFSEDDTYI